MITRSKSRMMAAASNKVYHMPQLPTITREFVPTHILLPSIMVPPVKRYVMVYDTETTGLLPKNRKPPLSETTTSDPAMPDERSSIEILNQEYPYITQLSYTVYDLQDEKVVECFDSYIQVPKEVELSEKICELTHISREKCDNGVTIQYALERFYNSTVRSDVLVAHNAYFDNTMIRIECRRNIDTLKNYIEMSKMLYLNNTKPVCTMWAGMRHFKLSKFPRLSELYELIFNESVASHNIPLHNALVDTAVCLRCYMYLFHDKKLSNEKFKQIITTIGL